MAWSLLPDQALVSSGVVSYVILAGLMALVAVWFFKRRQQAWMLDRIPGPKGHPILGNLQEFNLPNSAELFIKMMSMGDYGDIVRAWLGPYPYVFLFEAKAAEAVLSNPKFLEKSFDYNFIHCWLGTGLLTSTGSKWQSRRKMLTPAFHFKILEDFLEVFNDQGKKLSTILEGKANGKPFDIFPYITKCTLDIICETAMGTSVNAQDAVDNAYVDAIYKIGYMMQQRIANALEHPDFIYNITGKTKRRDELIKILHDFTLKTIRSRKKALAENKKVKAEGKDNVEEEEDLTRSKKKRLAFLDLLLEYSDNGQNLSEKDIQEEVDTFMFEGHDTTTAAINWSLFLLGLHPEIQAKVHEELDTVFGDSDRGVTPNDLRELKYLEICIKEALRIYPSVPFIGRQVREDVTIGDYRIPANTSIFVMIFRLHRDPKYFPDPEKFDPERFLPENSKGRHPYAYVPFSAGLRNCIGQKFALMEEKVILSTILRRFRVESTEKREEVRCLGELILRPEDGIKLKLVKKFKGEE